MKKGIGVYLIVLGCIFFLVFILSFIWMPVEEYTHKGTMVLTEEQKVLLVEVLKEESTKEVSFGTLGYNNSNLVSFEFQSSSKESLFGEEVEGVLRVEYILLAPISILLIIPGATLLWEC